MRRPNLPISLAILVVLVFAVSISAGGVQAASGPDISPRLARALAAGDFPWLAEDGSLTVWVFFRDKGLAGAALDKALDEAQDSLGQRAAWRRAKMKTAGERLVDVRDLDLCAAYIDQATWTGAVLRRKSRWLNAASFQADPGQIRQLAGLDCVLRVDLVNKFSRPEIPVEPVAARPGPADKEAADRWDIDYGGNLAAMEQFNVPQVHDLGITGQGVLIGMLDAGFHPTHEALADIPVLATYDFVNDDENVDNEEGDPADSRNHGTMTMSTAMGNKPGAHVAPAFGASAVLAKTEDVSQEVPIEEDQWVAGLEWVETYGVDIVSSSLGYLDWYDWEDMDGATAVTTIAADLAVARGMVVVNSAGNERGTSWDHIIAPADGDSVIAVGAVSSNGEYTYFSSPGPSYDGRIKPDVAALGSNNHVADPNNDTGYTYASGTSFSCPLTSGVAALILCRAPDLTPLQVREALRETASRADAPDNDYGWGLIDAYAAVTYFGPNFQHVPLPDTEDVTGPYVLGMIISDREGLDEATARVHYRTDGGSWLEVPIMATGGGPQSYFAEIPGQVDGTLVDYYLEAASVSGITTRLPAKAPEQFFTFRVGQDLTLPLLSHTPLRDQALLVWPPVVSCRASDNLGIDRVELTFKRNGGLDHGPYALVPGEDDAYELEFPLAAQDLAVGDGISYTLTAFDSAGKPNIAVSGPHDFLIIDPLGVVLVLEDNQDEADGAEPDLKIDGSRKDKPHLIPEVGKSSAGTITTWLLDAGYVAEMIPAAGVTVEDFAGYQVVVLSAGDNTEPVADVATRTALQTWAGSGGKLLIEGGEVGYDALNSPGYPEFAAQVLHAVDWDTDHAGDLAVAAGMANHPLLNIPYDLPGQIMVEYDGYGDEDAMEPADDAYAVLVPLSVQGDGGVIVHDDNPAPQSAQIVYMAFNIEALDSQTGSELIENALAFLLAPEAPPTANVLIDCRDSRYGTGEVAITGCTIQHNHQSPHSANIRIIGRSKPTEVLDPVREGNVTITGNVLSDVEVNVHLRDCRGVTVIGNTFWMAFTHNLLIEDSSNIIVGPNNFDRNPRYDYGNSLDAKNSLVVRNSEDCTLTGLHITNVWREPAGLLIENCRRINVTNCTTRSGYVGNPPLWPVGKLSQSLKPRNIAAEKMTRIVKLVQNKKNANSLLPNLFEKTLNTPVPFTPRKFILESAIGSAAHRLGQPIQVF